MWAIVSPIHLTLADKNTALFGHFRGLLHEQSSTATHVLSLATGMGRARICGAQDYSTLISST